jgi:hypothetical protein
MESIEAKMEFACKCYLVALNKKMKINVMNVYNLLEE